MAKKVGFIGTRFAGTDGVSLETDKWVEVFSRLGYTASFFSGLCDKAPAVSYVAPEAYFGHPQVQHLQSLCFGTTKAAASLELDIRNMASKLKEHLYHYIKTFKPDLLIIENALAIPMHIPLAIAITEVLKETGITTLAHHHDFYWERERFSVTPFAELLEETFPPNLENIRHVVINSDAKDDLYKRKNICATVIPNVHDFANPPMEIDAYSHELKKDLAIKKGELLFVQPTRIIARKGIELAIDLISMLREYRIRLVVPHHELDEGDTYAHWLVSQAEKKGVNFMCSPDIIGLERGTTNDNRRRYSLWDLYNHADFITYPSLYEGFGNAFLEAVYFGKPIFINRYKVYQRDIEPLGFQTISINNTVTEEAADQVRRLLVDTNLQQQFAQTNYDIARKYFSYEALEKLLAQCMSLSAR